MGGHPEPLEEERDLALVFGLPRLSLGSSRTFQVGSHLTSLDLFALL